MSNHNNTTSNYSLRMFLHREKLTGVNFVDWLRQLRIVLRYESKLHILEEPLPEPPATDATWSVRYAYEKRVEDTHDVACLMLSTMSSELQKHFEHMSVYDMMNKLKDMFQQQVREEHYECVKNLVGCRMQEGRSVSAHVLKMKAYVDQMERLGFPMGRELAVDIVLQSLPASYDQFIMNYHMHDMEKTLGELHGMLKTAESDMAKHESTSSIPTTSSREQKKKKKKPTPKGKVGVSKPIPHIESEDNDCVPHEEIQERVVCYFCGRFGDWGRHACPSCREDIKLLRKERVNFPSKGTFMIHC